MRAFLAEPKSTSFLLPSIPGDNGGVVTMTHMTSNPEFSQAYRIRLDPALEGKEICHFSCEKLFEDCHDLRDTVRALKDHPHPISPHDVVIDSDMKLHEAFRGLAADCPEEIVAQQELLRILYFGVDGKLHHGQVVIHTALANDVLEAFKVLLREGIPVGSVIPVSNKQFEVDGRWDDVASMTANNSSGFNYRKIITADGVGKRLSLHGLGMALDINPVQNPCYGSPQVHSLDGYPKEAAAGYKAVLPENGCYDLSHPAALHERHPVVQALEARGWTWGGRWADPKDLHHFQKIPQGLEERVRILRG